MTVTKRKAKPITAHPLFPIVTSLWFAAFLSLGSFAVAPQLLEGPVVALGIPEILPAAQPPLGFTVRALLAMVMLGVGGLAGYFIGKALAGGKADSPVRTRSFGQSAAKASAAKVSAAAPVSEVEPASARRSSHRRPLNPIEDLGEPMSAPFSGETYDPVDPQALEGFDFTRDSEDHARLPWEQEPEYEPMQRVEEEGAETTHLVLQPHAVQSLSQGEAQNQAQLDDPLALDLLFADAEVISKGPPSFDQAPFDQTPFDPAQASSASLFQTALPDQGGEAEPQDDMPYTEAEAMLEAELPAAQALPTSIPLIKTPLFQAPSLAPTPLSRTPLEDLGLVQLTERLALAISRRHTSAESRQPGVSHAFSPVEAAPESVDVEDAPRSGGFAEVQPQPAAAIARFGMPEAATLEAAVSDETGLEPNGPEVNFVDFSTHDERRDERVVQLRPTALQPFAPEPEAFDDEAPEFERFLRVREPKVATNSPASAFDGEDLDEDEYLDEESGDSEEELVFTATGAEADVAEERYPSLLDMGAGSLRHRVQHATSPKAIDLNDALDSDHVGGAEADIEPAVVFPGQEPHFAAPFETTPRLFERPANTVGGSDRIIAVAGSPLAAPGRAAPSSPIDALGGAPELLAEPHGAPSAAAVDAEEADRALRAALATLQRMTAQG